MFKNIMAFINSSTVIQQSHHVAKSVYCLLQLFFLSILEEC